MGQKDQDWYYAEKYQTNVNFGPKIHQFTNRHHQKKKKLFLYFVFKSHYLLLKQSWVYQVTIICLLIKPVCKLVYLRSKVEN